ncbi:MAG TPA: hypothetical protein VNX67_01880 [Solirubrobacteraceae bacterium]|nr:hypothetical protein [Solirubrobacteraceae bacterium]
MTNEDEWTRRGSLKWGVALVRRVGTNINMECAHVVSGVLKSYAWLLAAHPIPKSAVGTEASLEIVQGRVCSGSAVYADRYYVDVVLTTVARLYRSPVCV